MRQKLATALIGGGAFSIGLAVLLPLAITPALLKAPGDIDLTTHSRSAAQKLNSATGQMEDVTVDLTRTLSTHRDAKGKPVGSRDVGSYDELLNLAPVVDGAVQTVDSSGVYTGLKAGSFTVAFDRSTGVGQPGKLGDTWNTTGQTVKFPFGTAKKTYSYFDQTSKQAWPVDYVRTTTVKGLEVYEFHGTIALMSLGQYGVLAGTDTLYSNAGRTLLVEPVTGSIVSSTTSPQTSIKLPSGVVSPALLVDELVPTDATIANRVAAAKESKAKAQMLQRAPWVLGALAFLLLGGGILGRRRTVKQVVAPSRPDVSGALPTPRAERAIDLTKPKIKH